MSNHLLSIGIANAISQGVQGYRQGVEYKEQQKLNRKAAKLRQAEMDAQLRQIGAAADQGLIEQQIAEALAQSKAATDKLARLESYNFFDAYSIDKDPQHLNKAIKSLPALKAGLELGFGGPIAGIQPLDPLDPNNAQLLREEGFDPEEVKKMDLDNFKARYLKVIGVDGSVQMLDVATDLYASTGYFDYKDKKTQEKLLAESRLIGKPSKPGAFEAKARFIAETTGQSLKDVTAGLYTEEIAGNVAGKQALAASAENQLLREFGIDPSDPKRLEKFLSIDMTNSENKAKMNRLAGALEKYSDQQMSDRQKKDFERIAAGISSAEAAAGLKEPSTGLVDVPLNQIGGYINAELEGDSLEQKQARNAYYSLRNVLRHAISGASLTNAEIKAFNEAYGTLHQQLPSVLSGLVVQLRQTLGQINAISETGNPYAMQYRLGATRQNLEKIIALIDEKLSPPPKPVVEGTTPEERRKRIEEVFLGGVK